jgi:hypothetical protein
MSASDRKPGTTSSTSNIIRVSPSVAAGSESIVGDSASGDARRIDRAQRRHAKINSPPTKIERIELKVPSGTRADGQDKKTPQDGLRGKFSIYHAIASRAGRGRGRGEAIQRPAADPTVVALRSKVLPEVAPGVDPRQADMTILLIAGRTKWAWRRPSRRASS